MKKYLKQAKMKKKLMMTSLSIMGVFLVALIVSFIGLFLINGKIKSFYSKPYVNSTLQMEIQKDTQEIAKNILWATQTDDEKATQERIDAAQKASDEVDAEIAQLKGNFDRQDLIDEFIKVVTEANAAFNKIMELAKDNRNTEALQCYDNEFEPVVEKMSAVLGQIGESADEDAVTSYEDSQTTANVVLLAVVIITILSICMGTYLSLTLAKIIANPLQEIESAAKKMMQGNLDIQISYDSEDELGSLSNVFGETCERLRKIIEDLVFIVKELKVGNFQVSSQWREQYVGEFSDILDNLREMVFGQSRTLEQINGVSEQVAMGSSQMAESAQSLAEGATEQAGAVEELTATVEDVTSISEESAQNGEKAYQDALKYVEQAQSGKQEMANLIEAMNRITSASEQIEDIISEIEDIASQTNLLSLNASIEAARAGEAGKGFAVVADQIGKLANDSAKSAVRTKDLIQNSLAEIRQGNVITTKTQEMLDAIVDGIEYLSIAANGASEMSNSQVQTMREVERGIEQISNVVQNNSAAAEETSATSQELSAQASTLKELVGQFRLRELG